MSQSGVVVWFTGLPSSGKSTLAREVQKRLRERGVLACLLDSDALRPILAADLDYGAAGRSSFYAALAALAASLAEQGLVVLVAATAHRRDYRERARTLAARFIEVWVTTGLDECRRRDDKGLYAAAMAQPNDLPGVGVPYEAPEHPELTAAGGHDTWAIEELLARLSPDSTGRDRRWPTSTIR